MLKLTTDRHKASRDLSVRAELLVKLIMKVIQPALKTGFYQRFNLPCTRAA